MPRPGVLDNERYGMLIKSLFVVLIDSLVVIFWLQVVNSMFWIQIRSWEPSLLQIIILTNPKVQAAVGWDAERPVILVRDISEKATLACWRTKELFSPCENLEATYLICLLAFIKTRSFSVFCDLWLFKVPGQKTHSFLASASQRFLLWLTAPAFIFQFLHVICWIVFAGFILVLFDLFSL